MRFKDVIGHQQIKEQLANSFNISRLSHAYLFFGTEGIGKLRLAIAFAQYISCLDKKDNDSCGICSSCRKYEKLMHPDLHFCFPAIEDKEKETDETKDLNIVLEVQDDKKTSKKSKKSKDDEDDEEKKEKLFKKINEKLEKIQQKQENEDEKNIDKQWINFLLNNKYFVFEDWVSQLKKASGKEKINTQATIKKNAIEKILSDLSFKSYESDYKVEIIWLPELFNNTAANRLLKILEEPMGKTVFFLISNNPENILPTIYSRTQPLKITGIEDNILKAELIKQFQIDDNLAEKTIKICNGSFTEAKIFLSNSESNLANFNHFKQITNYILKSEHVEILKWVENISVLTREEQKQYLEFSLNYIRDIFIYQIKPSITYMNPDYKQFAQEIGKYVKKDNISQIYKLLNESYYYIERNSNGKILFTDLAYKLQNLLLKQ